MQKGDKVKVLECHSIPQSVGMLGVVEEINAIEQYPIKVKFDEPIQIAVKHPVLPLVGIGDIEFYIYREEELEVVESSEPAKPKTEIPDFLKEAFEEKEVKPKTGEGGEPAPQA